MKKRILLATTLLAIFTGCGQQPELDVNADQNKTVQTKLQQGNNQAEVDKNKVTTEENVDNTAVISVSEDSENVNKTQEIASVLSKNVVHFDFDKYNIKADQMPIIKKVADILADVKSNYTVRVEGNCDEWGSDEYNYALGLKRAKAVKSALIDLGVDENKLTIISYGESNPVCTEHKKECWAKNRRDNFTLLP